jgi:hypothetical protein
LAFYILLYFDVRSESAIFYHTSIDCGCFANLFLLIVVLFIGYGVSLAGNKLYEPANIISNLKFSNFLLNKKTPSKLLFPGNNQQIIYGAKLLVRTPV